MHDDVDELLAELDAELRTTGTLGFATTEALRRDPRRAGLESCLAILRCTVFAADPTTAPLPRRQRVHACRLMLLSLGAHTDTPRWTEFAIEQLFEAAMQTPGAELSDVAQAAFALFAEAPGGPTHAQAAFIRALGYEISGRRRRGVSADDFVWIAARLADPVAPVTEAQAYFATLALPRRMRGATREILLRTLAASPVADEVARTLADRPATLDG